MKKRGRLSILITLLLILSSLASSSLLFWQEIRNANRTIEQSGIDNLQTTLTHLQNMLNTQLATDSLEDARLSLSVSSLHPGIHTLLLANQSNSVMLANRYLWEGSQAAKVSGYNDQIAMQVGQTESNLVSFNGSLLRGYYPVTLKIVVDGEGANQIGVLFVEYGLAPQLAQARYTAAVQASLFGGLMIAVAIIVAMLLHWLVTRRVEKIIDASKRFAAGDMDVRVHLHGHDELTKLGHAFDSMASQRKDAQQALQQASIYNRSLIEANLDPLIITSMEGKITDVNQATEKATGRSRSELIGTNFQDCFSDPEKAREGYRQVLAERFVTDYPLIIRHTNGRLIDVLHNATVYKDTAGNVLGILAAARDVTVQKQAEQELNKYKDHLEEQVQLRTTELVLARDAAQAANIAKSAFLSSMSHELRTPLNAILGFSGLLRKDQQLSPSQRDKLETINRSGEHLLTLINDVLEMSKIEAGRVVLESAQQKGLRLLIDQTSEFPRYIKGDAARLRQMLINLIDNAVKFTHQGGVTVRFGIKPQDEQHHLLIEIEDSGIGISSVDQQRLFQPFVQLGKQPGDNKGTGLGLSITRQFIHLMGGTISVESTLGKGSIFRVELPVCKIEAGDVSSLEKLPRAEIVRLAPGQPVYRILIVEDQLDNQLLLTQLMNSLGFEVKVAGDGEQGIQLFKSWQPHLIWMDRRMPVMDGMEAAQAIRNLPGGREVKIVAVTASAFIEQRDEILNTGMDDFVHKPYRASEIYECLSRQFGVQYIYAGVPQSDAAPVELTAEMLTVLSPELRRELGDALESLEGERIEAALGKIAVHDAKLHSALSQLADNFDYPVILKLLQISQ